MWKDCESTYRFILTRLWSVMVLAIWIQQGFLVESHKRKHTKRGWQHGCTWASVCWYVPICLCSIWDVHEMASVTQITWQNFFLSSRYRLLSGNQISGSLPDELGNLSNLNRLQLDLNFISGPIPRSFANLRRVQHLSVYILYTFIHILVKFQVQIWLISQLCIACSHMNDNRFSGQIPTEITILPMLRHM